MGSCVYMHTSIYDGSVTKPTVKMFVWVAVIAIEQKKSKQNQ